MVEASLASCKKLQTEATPGGPQQQLFYALVLTNDQQHTFDITVTDGQTAWRGTGECTGCVCSRVRGGGAATLYTHSGTQQPPLEMAAPASMLKPSHFLLSCVS